MSSRKTKKTKRQHAPDSRSTTTTMSPDSDSTRTTIPALVYGRGQSQSDASLANPLDDRPIYVNPKQYRRILARRQSRAMMEERIERAMAMSQNANTDQDQEALDPSGTRIRDKDAEKGKGEASEKKKGWRWKTRHEHAVKRVRGAAGRFLPKDGGEP